MRTRCCSPATVHLAMPMATPVATIVAGLVAMASCGQVRLEPIDEDQDAAVSADAASPDPGGPADARSPLDAGAPADARPPCVWSAFDPPTRMFGIPDDDDWLGSLSEDGKLLVIDRYGETLNDLFIARRGSPGDPFGPAEAIDELNTPDRDSTAMLLAGGLEIYFASDRAPTPDSGLWRATRATADGVFDAPVEIEELSAGGLAEPMLTPDGLGVYFTSTRAGSDFGSRNLWFAERPGRDAPFSPPRPLDELNSDAAERAPGISADGLEIFFASERAGGAGELDLWRATRQGVDKPFGPPENVAELNTINDEVSPRLSADGSTLYFNYDTETEGNLDADVWQARRQCVPVAF